MKFISKLTALLATGACVALLASPLDYKGIKKRVKEKIKPYQEVTIGSINGDLEVKELQKGTNSESRKQWSNAIVKRKNGDVYDIYDSDASGTLTDGDIIGITKPGEEMEINYVSDLTANDRIFCDLALRRYRPHTKGRIKNN